MSLSSRSCVVLLFAALLLPSCTTPVATPTKPVFTPGGPGTPGGPVVTPPPAARCDDFENLPIGKEYHVGDTFPCPNTKATLVPFTYSAGGTTTGGLARVESGGRAGGSGQEMNVNNISLLFVYGTTRNRVDFRFGEYGGNINFAVNGDFRNVRNFADLQGMQIGGANITVVNGLGNDKGAVAVVGSVNTLTIGGQELYIDELCTDRQRPTTTQLRSPVRRAFEEARAAESAVTADLMALDREARRSAARETTRGRGSEAVLPGFSAPIARRETQLYERDLAVNRALEEVYRLAIRNNDPATEAELVRAALLHWTSLLRRRSMGSWHTKVPGLVNDTRCRGDVIGDEMFQKYFDTLFETSQTTADERRAVGALADLARQSACLGEQQSAILASNLYWSFAEVRSFLTWNGLDRIIPAVAQAGAAPLLLFYDVEKSRGPGSPLARWFSENERHLIEGAVTHRIPGAWQGLWLYDRRNGYLRGFRINRTPRNENEVDAVALFASIVRTENLGDFSCPFSEMVQRGPSEHGYLCAAASCQKAAELAAAGNTAGGVRQPVGVPTTAVAFGHSTNFFEQISCSEGRPDVSGGSTGGPCPSATRLPGRETLAAVFDCVANLRMGADQRFMRCFAEATGRCANPIDRFTKHIEQASYRGVPLGNCALMQDGGDAGSPPPDPPPTDDDVEPTPLIDEEEEMRQALEELRQLEEALKEAREALEAAKKDHAAEDRTNTPDYVLTRAQRDLIRAYQAVEAIEKKLERAKEKYEQVKNRNQKRCPRDTPDCGTNQCTAMSVFMMALQKCAAERLASEQPRQPGETPFEPIDPSPESPDTSAAAALCMESVTVTNVVNQRCWAVRCTNEATTVATAGGDCGCGPAIGDTGGGFGLGTGGCGYLDCGENSYQEGCKCVPFGNNLPPFGGPPQPGIGSVTVSAPPRYSDVNFPPGSP